MQLSTKCLISLSNSSFNRKYTQHRDDFRGLIPSKHGKPRHSTPEVLQNIFSYLTTYQSTLHACTLVSNSWYKSSVPFLYNSPAIDGKTFDLFVKAICPSVNAHVRINGLAALVRKLDMSLLVHNGSKSLTARLLGRVKGNLEEFVAPQASFAYVQAMPKRAFNLY